MQRTPRATDELIRTAIAQKRLIELDYKGHRRIVEPHDYGIRHGKPQLLAFQIGGRSSSGKLPNWRWIELSGIPHVRLLDRSFSGRRAAPSGQHTDWDDLFIRVSAADDSSST